MFEKRSLSVLACGHRPKHLAHHSLMMTCRPVFEQDVLYLTLIYLTLISLCGTTDVVTAGKHVTGLLAVPVLLL